MKPVTLRLGAFLTILLIFAAGCAPSQTATPGVSNPVLVPATETVAAQPATPAASGAATSAATPASASQSTTQASSVPNTGGMVWTVVPDQSQARYRVREQLARLNFPSDAVGKTNAISGQVVIKPDGSIDTSASKFTVDVSTLASDEGMRDNFVRRNILLTSQYPNVTFVPTQVSGLPSPLPASGNVSFKVTGNLTVMDVTKPVTWDVTGKVQNGTATGTATTSFTFEDFNLNQPRVPVVLSVVDKITLEVDLTLKQSGS